jgi:transposase
VPKGKVYTPEFKEQAVKRVIDNSLPIAQVARELGINDTTLGFWVKDYRKKLDRQPHGADKAVELACVYPDAHGVIRARI